MGFALFLVLLVKMSSQRRRRQGGLIGMVFFSFFDSSSLCFLLSSLASKSLDLFFGISLLQMSMFWEGGRVGLVVEGAYGWWEDCLSFDNKD
jgi:hypothetical protein